MRAASTRAASMRAASTRAASTRASGSKLYKKPKAYLDGGVGTMKLGMMFLSIVNPFVSTIPMSK